MKIRFDPTWEKNIDEDNGSIMWSFETRIVPSLSLEGCIYECLSEKTYKLSLDVCGYDTHEDIGMDIETIICSETFDNFQKAKKRCIDVCKEYIRQMYEFVLDYVEAF